MDLNPICCTTVSYTLSHTPFGNLDNVTPKLNGVNFFNLFASFVVFDSFIRHRQHLVVGEEFLA